MGVRKLLVVDDIARILGRKITLDPPDILLYTVTSRGTLLASGPYSHVTNENDELVQVVVDSTFFWDSAAQLVEALFKSLARRPNIEYKFPKIPQKTPAPPEPREPLPKRRPLELPPKRGSKDATMEYIPPASAKDQERVILRRY